MGIIEDRKKRASEFISVRNVMMAMSQHSGLSAGEVAGEFIYQFDLPGENPAFYRQDPATLVMSESDGTFMRAILKTIARWGRLDWPDRSLPAPSDLDEFGWNRHDIGTYLLVFMGYLPDCCDPDWEPIAEVSDGSTKAYEPIVPFNATACESADQRRARLRKAVAEIRASENISISKAFNRLAGGEFGGKSNISNMYYPRKK
jgi:hypothetical protein